MIELNKIYNIDCIERQKMIKDKTIELIIKYQPYNKGINGKNNKGEKWNKFSFPIFCFGWRIALS